MAPFDSKGVSFQKTNRKRKRMKLVVGQQVEVRSDEDGFQGSWHAGTVTACGVGFCKVRYLHLLDNDGKDYLLDTIKVSGNLEGNQGDNGCVNNIRPLRQDVGFGKFGLYYGLCVDALHNDAWWEGVVFDHEDVSDKRSVFFPDLGDEMQFEIGMLRQALDWDEYTEEWTLRGDWVFLKLIEELAKDCPLTVSVKQLWYDLQEKDCFNNVGKWKCRDEALWREAILEISNFYFTMTVNDLCDSLGCLTDLDLDSERGPLMNTVEKMDMDLSRAIVTTRCASNNGYGRVGLQLGDGVSAATFSASSEGSDNSDSDDCKTKDELFTHSVIRAWLPAENVIVSKPEFCPDVITDYLQISGNRRKNLSQSLRKHLLYLGWKIEYRNETSMTRMRYTSPVGKVYMSLVKICEDMSKDSEALCSSSEDKGSPPPPKDWSRKMLLDRPGYSQKPNVTCSTSTADLVFEPEICPEAVENWCKYINGSGSAQSQSREVKSLKAKKHLSAMGWSFSYIYKDKRRELRYLSPKGKYYYSLRKACQACIKDNGTVKCQASGNSKPNMTVIENTENHLCSANVTCVIPTSMATDSLMLQTPQQLNMDLRLQSKALVVLNQIEAEKNQKTKQIRRVDGIQPESARGKKRRKTQVKHTSKPASRASKRAREAAIHNPSNNNPRTVLSWLIDHNAVLPRAKVQYISKKNGQPLKAGSVSREGIRCSCCDKMYSLSAFEAHAGSSNHRPSANIFLKDGRSLMECQRQMLSKATELNTEKKIDQKGKRAYPENDILCSICHYGGELMLCDRCPASFHMICLGLKEIPDGDWFCPSCCCVLCGRGEFNFNISEDDVLRCYQCEQQYHLSCLKERKGSSLEMDAKGNRFCSVKCKKICSGLNNLLGRPFALGSDNLTWTLVAASECGSSRPDFADVDMLTENYSKLSVALSIIHECFEPLKDPRTKRDIVEDIIFSRSSDYSRLNYRGFYTVILEQNEELITAAAVRIFGDKVAEVPIVGTRFKYRRLGMCRFLMNELERKLMGLGIERLVLPAVPSVLKTWTTSFGFSPMTESERVQLLSYTFLDFQGTTLCQKFLQQMPPAEEGPQHETMIADELRKCDGAFILDEKRQTSEILQIRNEEQAVARGMPLSEEIINRDQQAATTDVSSSTIQGRNISHSSKDTCCTNLKQKRDWSDTSNLKIYKRRVATQTI